MPLAQGEQGGTATVTVALWGANFAWQPAHASAWLKQLAAIAEKSAAQGAKILVLPEYISLQWLVFASAYEGEQEASARQADIAASLQSAMQALSTRLDLTIVAGTAPHATEAPGRFVNRCPVFFPEGVSIALEKLCLTPPEKNEMGIVPGTAGLPLFHWRGLRFAVLICLDCELPALAAKLARAKPDLVLIPSQTSTLAGYHRVFSCARARAIELACPVAVVGGIGTCHFPSGAQETNVSGAACYLPCESGMVPDGVLSQDGPFDAWAEPEGLLHIARNIPLAACRALREGKADVWPGAWNADAVTLSEKIIPAPIAGQAA